MDRLSLTTPQIPKPRIQGISDLIFGLALSIGALQFIGNLPTDSGQLTWDLVEFGFSFLILIGVWNRYTATTSVMPVESVAMIRLNMVLLFLVAIEPFLFSVLFGRGLNSDLGLSASTYYALDIGGMNVILAYFTHVLASEERNLIPHELVPRYKTLRNLILLSSAMFFASDLPVFWDVVVGGLPLRIWLWFAALPVVFLPRLFVN